MTPVAHCAIKYQARVIGDIWLKLYYCII